MNDNFPAGYGVPMHLLTERGLHRAFFKVVEEHRRDGRPVVTDRNGQPALVNAGHLENDVCAARLRIAEIDAEIARFRRACSLDEALPDAGWE